MDANPEATEKKRANLEPQKQNPIPSFLHSPIPNPSFPCHPCLGTAIKKAQTNEANN
jgi:hypothetical protein